MPLLPPTQGSQRSSLVHTIHTVGNVYGFIMNSSWPCPVLTSSSICCVIKKKQTLEQRVTLVMLMVGSVFASATARFSLFSGTKSSFTSSMIPLGKIFCTQEEKANIHTMLDKIDYVGCN